MAVAAVVAGNAEDLSTSLKLAAWFPVCLLLLSIDYIDIHLNWSQWQVLTPGRKSFLGHCAQTHPCTCASCGS